MKKMLSIVRKNAQKIISTVQWGLMFYIYCVAGSSDLNAISFKGMVLRVIIALFIIAILQIIKKVSAVRVRKQRTSPKALKYTHIYDSAFPQKCQCGR